jgi:UDP-N-acetylglucosamine--N-acetylmuramyl-(pentapeptide) pyrophosphoryl-undecaprenol N-acetylglucosamine transferase
MNSAKRVLITASGTGGHLFPARFIIEALQADNNATSTKIHFVGSGRPLEKTILGKTGISLSALTTVGIKRRGIVGLLQFLLTTPVAIAQTLLLFARFRPQVVIGVGGYATFFPIMLAWVFRIPRWIHEAERAPGLANKILSRFATKVSLAFEDATMPAGAATVYTGHPVRSEIRSLKSGAALCEQPKRLLVMGGSQGAQALDVAMPAIADVLASNAVEVWHQARPENVESVSRAYVAAGVSAKVVPFVDDLAAAYSWAELVVSRSGAGAVSELAIVNIPSVLVPYPFAQDDHQTANAKLLSDQGKAVLVAEGEGFEDRLRETIAKICSAVEYKNMRDKQAKSRVLDGAQSIAVGALGLV